MKPEITKQYLDKLIEEFIATINAHPNNTKKLFIIGFVGLTGVGKSFIAKKISERLGLHIGSNDNIRRFLNKQGFDGASPVQEAVQEIALASTRYLFENKISHIIDADLIKFHDVARKTAKDYGARFYIVHLICPENIVLKRIEMRSNAIIHNSSDNLSRVGKDEYFKRKALHESLPLPEIFYTINTAKDVAVQLDELINKLKEEK